VIKYAEKYPDPGPRPAEEAEPATFTSDAFYRAWRDRAAAMQSWQTRKRQHEVARAIDDILAEYGHLYWKDRGAAANGSLVIWFSYLQEPLPPEVFP